MFVKVNYIIIIFIFILTLSGCSFNKQEINLEDENTASTPEVMMEELSNLVKIEDKFELPILLFHHIGNPPASASAEARTWYVSVEKFEEILKKIDELDYETLFMQEVLDYIEQGEIPEKVLVIDFDDGAIDFYDNAWSLLQKYEMKSSMNIMTGIRGKNYLNKDQILELDETGLVEFQSHTVYHPYLTRIDFDTQKEELEKSKKYLEELLEKEIKILAYPFGLYDEGVIKLAKDLGYKIGMTIKPSVEQDINKMFEFRRNIITENTDIDNILSDD